MRSISEVTTDTILIVDDDPNVIAALKRLLHSEPYNVLTVLSGEEALELMEEHAIDLVLCDEKMPGLRGSDVLRVMKDKWPDTIRIMLSGQVDVEAVVRAINEGEAYRFISKPWNEAELLLTVSQAMEKGHLIRENRRLTNEIRKHEHLITMLENQHPGITQLNLDSEGVYIASSD